MTQNLIFYLFALNPSAASLRVSTVQSCVLVASVRTHTHHHLELGVCVCVCVCVCVWGALAAISITVSAAKWGERHRQPTGMLLLFWGSGSRGPDCFAQGQHDLGIVIYILVDCTLSFRTCHPGSLSMQSLGQNLTSIAHHLGDHQLLDWNLSLSELNPGTLVQSRIKSHLFWWWQDANGLVLSPCQFKYSL